MQTATVLSQASQTPFDTGLPFPACNATGWVLNIQYVPDAGGTQQTQIAVGGANPTAFWSAANVPIRVTVPGCANPVIVPCPDIIKWTLFGTSVPGIPFQ